MFVLLRLLAAGLLFTPLTELFVGASACCLSMLIGFSLYVCFSAGVMGFFVTLFVKHEPFSELLEGRRRRNKGRDS